MDLGLDQVGTAVERFAKLPKPYRLAFGPVVAVLIVAAYVYLSFLPARAELETLRADALEHQRKLNEVRSVAANLPKFEEELTNLENELTRALRRLPDSKELPVLLTDITTLGKNAGLEFTAFRPQSESVKNFYAEVPIEIEFTGRFHDIAAFFDEIARLPRIVNVSELKMTILESSPLDTILKAKGRAITFRFVDPTAGAGKKQASLERDGGSARGRGGVV
jgi:type IV pilus assembly protein PilO